MTLISKCSLLPFIALLSIPAAFAAEPSGAIDPERLSQSVKMLASNEFEGRAPGTPGETKTVEWLSNRFRELGLEPGGERGSWTQAVPLVRTQIGTPATMSITAQGKERALTQSSDIYVSTVRKVDRVLIKSVPMSSSATASPRRSASGTITSKSICTARSPCTWSTIPTSTPGQASRSRIASVAGA